MTLAGWFIIIVFIVYGMLILTSPNRKYLLRIFLVNALIIAGYGYLFFLLPPSDSIDVLDVLIFIIGLASHIIILLIFMIGRYHR
jgi:uncharacterized membrane protein